METPKVKAVAMARGTIILDEHLRALEPFLLDKNIRVRMPPQGTPDETIAHDWLPNRVFLTGNSKDFVEYASEYDIGIIATENVKSKDAKNLADLVSKAIMAHNLWSIRHGFILTLMESGKHEFKELTD